MIAFYGGSFDPIHEGHIHLAKALLNKYAFDKFFFCPNFQNPLKNSPCTATENRLAMLEASLREANEPKFEILDWEITKPQPSYTVTTLRQLRTGFPNEELVLILGSEVFAEFQKWRSPLEILSLANAIVVARNQKANSVAITEILERVGAKTIRRVENRRWLHGGESRWVILENVDALPYSSSQLRTELEQMWSQGHDLRPPQGLQRLVWQVIKEKRLYAVT